MTYVRTLEALADGTRREILERLRAGECPVGKLAECLPVSRPAVSQHLKVLKSAGLVSERRAGTRRFYAIDRSGLAELREYLEGFWDEALVHFATHLSREPGSHGSGGQKKAEQPGAPDPVG